MNLNYKHISLILLMLCTLSYGQMNQYNYTRLIEGVNQQWHALPLPDAIFGKVSNNLSDLRIYGVTNAKDTIEVPYLLRIKSDKIQKEVVIFNMLNSSHNEEGYFYTFEVPTEITINQIKLNLGTENFDWKLNLQGSQNQKDWLTIQNDFRILSIKNEATNYSFTTITLPNSKYRYFRVFIKSDKNPNLITAQIFNNNIIKGTYKNYPLKTTTFKENKAKKATEITVDLENYVPISLISLKVKESFDYYRHVKVSKIIDSLKTEKGWKYNYETLYSGTLNSLEKSTFNFKSTLAQKIKITIYNEENQPITIDEIEVKGFLHEMVARFNEQAIYYFTYGNKQASFPKYDIAKFSENIPDTLSILKIGDENMVKKVVPLKSNPIFKNEAWLWSIIALIMLILGWFSMQMIKK